MAVNTFFPVIAAGNGGTNVLYAGTLGAGANSGVIVTGLDMIIRIAASLPITVRFGPSASLSAATATDIYLPADRPEIFDMCHANNAISIYAFQAGTVVTVNLVVRN